ncbi:hypothetical protein [Haloferula sp. BvORR071]|uniref:hypothetical protein n=1 Tax=Haloferula sp. BvORR071 TaxID=1396141 RepID=UPI00054F5D69|nr:hypothetical protein [Haloferula sp. BvORR071]
MNTSFILTPLPSRLHQALQSDLEGSGGAQPSPLTRRRFLKRTGGATIASFVVWNMATHQLEAGTGSPSASTSSNKEITKSTGTYSPTPDYSTPGSIVVTGSSTYSQTKAIRWEFSYKVKLGAESQPNAVDEDCASCSVSEVVLKLVLHEGNLKLPNGKSYTPPSYAGPSLKRGYTVTNNGSCPGNPKAHLGTLGGELDAADNNITIKIVGPVSPSEPSATKTIAWEVTPTNNVNVATIKGQMETAIKALYPNGHTVVVNMPNVAMSGDQRFQTVTAVCTNREVKGGTGCSFP